MKILMVMAAALSVSACVSHPLTETELGPAPKDYRTAAALYLKPKFFDRLSVRDAEITPPFIGRIDGKAGWVVCTKQNSKNQFGGYTGIQGSAILFRNGVPVDHSTTAAVCENDPHTPWPELIAIAKS